MSPILKIKSIADFAAVKAAEVNAELFSGYALRDELRKISKEYEIGRAELSSACLDPMHNFNKDIESSMLGRSEIEKELSLVRVAATANYFDLPDSIGSAASKVMAVCDLANATAKAAELLSSRYAFDKEFKDIQDSFLTKASRYALPDSIHEISRGIAGYDSVDVFSELEKATNRLAFLDTAIRDIKSISSIEKLTHFSSSFDSMYEKRRRMADYDLSNTDENSSRLLSSEYTIGQILKEVSESSALAKTISSFASPFILDEKISTASTDISSLSNHFKSTYEFEELFKETNIQISNSQDAASVLEALKKAHPAIQKYFLFIFNKIFFPILLSIAANIITPSAELYKKEKINHINDNILISTRSIKVDNVRFISGNNVYLRKSSSVDSNVLDTTKSGQVVTVISKRKNWIEVEYKNENDEIMHGWVFTRYTKKLVK